jgi:hypothetical protein
MGEQKTHTKGAKVRGGHKGIERLSELVISDASYDLNLKNLCDLL